MTRALNPAQLLEASERGGGMHPIDRALATLRLATPEGPDPAALAIAERDRQLFALRRATFGEALACTTRCPACEEKLEFQLEASDVASGLGAVCPREVVTLSGWVIALRPLDSRDLAAAARATDRNQAGSILVRRALDVLRRPEGSEENDLPDSVLRDVEQLIGEREAAGDVAFALQCTACGAAWTTGFDIGAHLWLEINAVAQSILMEVAMLARCFGWSEADILAMSSARRRAYLDAAGIG